MNASLAYRRKLGRFGPIRRGDGRIAQNFMGRAWNRGEDAVLRGGAWRERKKAGARGASRLWDGSLRESGFFFVFGEFHEEGFDEAVEFAVHHGVYIGGLESCAVVFDATVVEHIRTDL